MSEKSQWYYVENQERKGPLTFSALKQMVGRGVISEQTLVWKEGMKDWQPASSVNGLFDAQQSELPKINVNPGSPPKSRSKGPVATPVKSAPTEPQATPNVDPTANKSPVDIDTSAKPSVTPTQSPSPQANSPQANSPQATGPQVAGTQFSVDTAAPGPIDTGGNVGVQTNSPARRSGQVDPGNLMQKLSFLGYPCLIAGFLLVISAKGCDSLGNRWAGRLQANASIAEDKFNATYERKRNSLQAQIDSINDSSSPDNDRLTSLNKRISELNTDQSKERQRLQRTTWSDLKISARLAQSNNRAWGFFRELAFVFGSMVLSIGLLVLGLTGNSSEKWTCLIMLAIITFSIYIGGFAWMSSIVGNVGPGMGF